MIMKQIIHHPILSQPFISVGLTALSLLLLVMVLLSVPGPIKGLYWFSIISDNGDELSAGVLGWCMSNTSNCTYAPLSENPFLSTIINTGESLLVKTLLPLSCYWMIISFLLWIALVGLLPLGYKIKNLDSILKHLRFSFLESFVLCICLFGNILTWLAVGTSRTAFNSLIKKVGKSDKVESGNAMETTAVAAFISLLALLFAIWGLHLRLTNASKQWKEQAIMVRRRSIALHSQGLVNQENIDSLGIKEENDLNKRLSIISRDSSANTIKFGQSQNGFTTSSSSMLDGGLNNRNSIYKSTYQPQPHPPQPQQNQVQAQFHSQSRSNSRNQHDNEYVEEAEEEEDKQEHLDVLIQQNQAQNGMIKRFS